VISVVSREEIRRMIAGMIFFVFLFGIEHMHLPEVLQPPLVEPYNAFPPLFTGTSLSCYMFGL